MKLTIMCILSCFGNAKDAKDWRSSRRKLCESGWKKTPKVTCHQLRIKGDEPTDTVVYIMEHDHNSPDVTCLKPVIDVIGFVNVFSHVYQQFFLLCMCSLSCVQ